jgi:hypothetical protein
MADQTPDKQAPPANPAAQADGMAVTPPKGDARTGMSFWNTATFITAGASDLVKPVADFAIFFLIGFALATGVAVYLTYIRQPHVMYAKTLLGTLGLGTAVFGFLVLGRLATPEGVGQERGIIASFVPPVAAVQTAMLPLSPTQKELLNLGSQISSGDPEARSAAARAVLADPKQDKPTRRAMLERILKNSDPNVQQAGLVSAMHDRGRGSIPVLPDRSSKATLATALAGSSVEFYGVNEQTGAVAGVFHTPAGTRGFSGSIANGRLVMTAEAMLGDKWTAGIVIDVAVDNRLQLVGNARTPAGDTVKVEMPIL